MRTFYIYTDASSKNTSMYPQGVKRTTKVGVIVVNSHIFDIYYKRIKRFWNSNIAERQVIIESIYYVKSKYNAQSIIIYTDALSIKFTKDQKNLLKNIKIFYVKGHCPNRKGLKYKFNCLADWISRNGIHTWKNYYYRHLL